MTYITLAATNVKAMVAFYTHALGAELEEVAAYDTKLFRGTLAGHGFIICPNEILRIDARRSRHQLKYRVADIKATYALALRAGGRSLSEIAEHAGAHGRVLTAALYDPDGNSLELEQLLDGD